MSKELISNMGNVAINLKPSRRISRLSDNRVNITRILLTGGPCAGKTTALAAISQDLTQLGYKVLVVPEAATMIMKGGAMIVSSHFTEQQGLQFQKSLMRLQIALEDTFLEIAQMIEGQPVIILVDRGLLDGSAYVSQNNWQALLDDLGANTVMLRDSRYDAVLHLVTAADGAEQFYASLNNEARYESVAEAVEKDKRIREAYLGHRHWKMIDNNVTDFNSKISKAKETIQHFLGHNAGQSFYRKFLLKKSEARNLRTTVPIEFASGQAFEESQVYETFIKFASNEGKVLESSIEKKGQNRAFTYTHKILLERNGQKMLKKRSISASEYIELSQNRIEQLKQVYAQRICMIDEKFYMIFDYYPEIEDQPLICVIQIDEEEHRRQGNLRLKLPSYLNIDKDITDVEEYQPIGLATKSAEKPKEKQ